MPTNLVVLGAGGFGRETLDVVEAWNVVGQNEPFHVLGIIDDGPSDQNLARLAQRGYSHLGSFNDFNFPTLDFQYIIGIGDPTVRERIAERCLTLGWYPGTVVHPSAVLGSEVSIGAGSIVCAGVQLSTNVIIGQHVQLNPGSIVGHDSTLQDFVSVNPGAIISGEVEVRARTLVGAGAVILQNLDIPEDVVIGASACVTKAPLQGSRVAGIPARTLNRGNDSR